MRVAQGRIELLFAPLVSFTVLRAACCCAVVVAVEVAAMMIGVDDATDGGAGDGCAGCTRTGVPSSMITVRVEVAARPFWSVAT